ncbi:ABC transporter ATP-binding protein [Tunturiibacter psychrotolerans]|uniref:ABC transporter ATP-binding protein n=1 Tax=Tunturiibacter psychrotolerans TaxID=3069686 RepID=UPI003D23E980
MKQLSSSSPPAVVQLLPVPEAPIISVVDVTMSFPIVKRYREMLLHPLRPRRVHTALSSVTIEIQRGDRVAVMGPNGAGKTTLLKLIGGLILPTKGDVVVDGFNTNYDSGAARKSVGFVLNEERSFFWRLTGAQNLEFFGTLDNLGGVDLRNRIQELTSLVGLEEAAARVVEGYSSGMKQRLALARGLITAPSVLILDEPTRALDPIASDEMIDLILSRIYVDSRKTLLIATHRMDEALKLCNKVLVIDKGRVQAFDTISDLKRDRITLPQYYRRALAVGEI